MKRTGLKKIVKMKRLIGVGLGLLCQVGLYSQTLVSSNLPIIVINTEGRTIVDSPKTTVQMKIIYNGASKRTNVTDAPNVYDGLAGIEFRGSSSQMFPKKPYGFELRDDKGEGTDARMCH
jgi:hypothetical protein